MGEPFPSLDGKLKQIFSISSLLTFLIFFVSYYKVMGETSLDGKLKQIFSISSLLPLLCILCTALLVYNVSRCNHHKNHRFNCLLSVHYHHHWRAHKRLIILRQFTGLAFYYWTINISPFSTTYHTHSIGQNQQCLIRQIIITIVFSIVSFTIFGNIINHYICIVILCEIIMFEFTSITKLQKDIISFLSALVHIHCDKTNSWLLRPSSSCQRHFSRGDSEKSVQNYFEIII